MIVDDSIKNAKKKREAVLNPNFKYIGISATDECTDSKTEDMNKDNANNGENNEGNNNSKNLPFCAYFSFK